jgi:ribonuclease-3
LANKTYRPLQKALGYEFQDLALLDRAITHRSHAAANNERLEFLGDALINFVIGEYLFRMRPTAEEGALSRLRASLVREPSLAVLARELKLGDAIKLGEGELKSGGWRRDSVLADTFEAVLGAIYLDGGFEMAKEVCLRCFDTLLQQLPDPETLKDPKTRLQEWLQARSRPLPIYEVLSEAGPPHRRQFVVRARLLDMEHTAEAFSNSRRSAEQKAAELLLQRLQVPTT